jgi:hypothetical protein
MKILERCHASKGKTIWLDADIFAKHNITIPQLPSVFFNMLQQVLSQLAVYSTNTVNIGFVERGDNGANLNIAHVLKISKLVACFFGCIENHIFEWSYPDTIPAFTPRDGNQNHKSMSAITAAHVRERVSTFYH